jgi:hypothetical protein
MGDDRRAIDLAVVVYNEVWVGLEPHDVPDVGTGRPTVGVGAHGAHG